MANRLSFTELSAAVSGGTLVLSVLYEWAYFKVAGFELMGLMTVSDLFRLALTWLPLTVLTFLALVMNELITQGIEKGLSEEELIATSPHPKFYSAFRKSAPKALISVFLLIAAAEILFSSDPNFSAIGLSLTVIWGVISNKITDVPRIREKYGATGCLMIVTIPIVAIMCLGFGAGKAQSDLNDMSNYYDVEMPGGNLLAGVNIIRSLERGILIKKESEKNLNFLPWSQVLSIHAVIPKKENNRSFACRVVSELCVDFPDQN
ncbi:hypothetical protein [Thalassospira sp. GB04J01]|uniref:hypothetical protein n=1 Tax=Thalassospira sp. GB04J01 TaxID=1485225 RepID=UPI000C9B9E23|nr:hypothetical protein [Thalassospira sp. GB04J01]|tara:strand:+ start:207 stop:995 length:789 start_codon:yes stop_codon:yes gene_type:complete